MKIPRTLTGKKGFTLVELIFEITVLAVLIIPTAILLVQLALDIVQTETNSIATSLCVQKSEDIVRAYTFATVDTITPNGTFPSPYGSYSFTVSVQCVNKDNPNITEACCYPPSCSPQSDYKRVTVTVSNASLPNPVNASLLFTRDVI